mmetsp:Transcript_35058/g.68718  ORF Transcript_35058/g.68718 Transcript_35058/m.68718 type:complete len:206 (-) Transcript_35058:198-815(-)
MVPLVLVGVSLLNLDVRRADRLPRWGFHHLLGQIIDRTNDGRLLNLLVNRSNNKLLRHFFGVEIDRVFELLKSLLPVAPRQDLHPLLVVSLGLKLLVKLEKLLNLRFDMLRYVLDVADGARARLIVNNSDKLSIPPLLVFHVHYPHQATLRNTPCHQGKLGQYQDIDRVAIIAERLRHKPIVSGVEARGVKYPVELEGSRLFVKL